MLEAEGDDQDQGHGDGAVPGVALQKRTSFLMNLLSYIRHAHMKDKSYMIQTRSLQ